MRDVAEREDVRAWAKVALVSLLAISLASCAGIKPQPAAPASPLPAPVAPPAPAGPPAQPPTIPPQQAEQPFFIEEGIASFYGNAHQGKHTAMGERFDLANFTAAHRTLPFGTIVRVTDLHSGRMVKVRINDRGPHVKGRVIDLSAAAARALGIRSGLARVRVEAFPSDQPGHPAE